MQTPTSKKTRIQDFFPSIPLRSPPSQHQPPHSSKLARVPPPTVGKLEKSTEKVSFSVEQEAERVLRDVEMALGGPKAGAKAG
eukprot:612717-Amorphochlora_amoeboformis.AAC.1